MSKPDALLHDLLSAEKSLRRLYRELAPLGGAALWPAIEKIVRSGVAAGDNEEAASQLVPAARLLGDLEGATTVDLLIDILESSSEEARSVAGEVLESLAFDRFKEVALGVERALQRLSPESLALSELPYVLASVPEPGVTKVLEKFLSHANADAAATAIEALVEVGDPSAAKAIARLHGDTRQVDLMGEDGGDGSLVSLGELADEAAALLSAVRT